MMHGESAAAKAVFYFVMAYSVIMMGLQVVRYFVTR